MPYLESLGFQWRYEGRKSIEGFLKFVRDLYPDMDFHDVKVVCETPEVVVGEYEFTTDSSKTGRTIHQLFVAGAEYTSKRTFTDGQCCLRTSSRLCHR
jgi:hypothetical protein